MSTTASVTAGHVLCKLSVPLPVGVSYLQRVSVAHPAAVFEVQAIIPTQDGRIWTSLRISSPTDIERLLQDIESSPDVQGVDVIGRDVEGATLHVVADLHEPNVFLKAIGLGLIPEFPTFVKAGHFTPIVAAKESTVMTLYDQFRNDFPGTTILSIRKETMEGMKQLLTPHQLDIFRTALASGYWDVPRRISITMLASVLGVSKSTLSKTLAIVESKLMHNVPASGF